MGNVAIFAVFLVLIASFAISVWSARQRSSDLLQDFLFVGNTPILALSSCIGSIISMAVSFTALLSAGYLWGWQMIFPMVAGALAGLVAILKVSEHQQVVAHEQRVERGAFVYGASYLAIIDSGSKMSYYAFLLAGYTAMLITEIVVLRTFIGVVTDLPAYELLLTICTLLLVCYGYVFIGGFRGVLVTDYFQLLVVFVFVGLWLTAIPLRGTLHVQAPFVARFSFTPLTRILLHGGIFAGAFAWTFASVDQWYRTLGTLRRPAAKQVLKSSALALCVFGVIPVLAGAASIGRSGVPSAVTNGISLFLITHLLADSNVTLRFVFTMALTCAGLTTLNTYIMTMQQLYYEASTRVDSTHWLHYILVKYPLKWKSVRGFVAALTGSAFVASCYFPERYVYAFGVLSLSCFILMLPFMTAALCEVVAASRSGLIAASVKLIARRLLSRGALTIGLGIVVWSCLMFAMRATIGPLTLHLYAIPATALAAAMTGAIVAVSIPETRLRISA